jgi:predicted aminopeptidase
MSQVAPSTRRERRFPRRGVFVFCAFVGLVVLLSGCSSVRYYKQAAVGQYEIFSKQQPIDEVMANPATTAALRQKLQLVLDLRRFAETNLHLETDGHYSRYADLGRRFVVWNVYAAPEFSLEPKRWWYPVVGKLKYRGYFSEKDARACAEQLKREGYDVHVGGVDAYSTLGWFKDPVLNTFLDDPPVELAETLFHELAHQRVFASGDTDFNEAFATAVGEEGTRRWLAMHGTPKQREQYEEDLKRKDQFVSLVMSVREELRRVYGEEVTEAGQPVPPSAPASVEQKRAAKSAVIAKMRAEYEKLKAGWGGDSRYDNWFKRPINNAQLGTVAAYYHFVPAFKRLLADNEGDLGKFYAAAKSMAGLTKDVRHGQLATLTKPVPEVAAVSQPAKPVTASPVVAQ